MVGFADQINYGAMTPTVGQTTAYAPMVNETGHNAPQMNGGYSAYGQIQTPQMGGYTTPQLTGWQKFGYVMDGIGAIGGLWGAIQQNKIAKQQLALSRDSYETNMRNTIQNYNTTLEDRIRARYVMEGRGESDVTSYLDRHSLRRNA